MGSTPGPSPAGAWIRPLLLGLLAALGAVATTEILSRFLDADALPLQVLLYALVLATAVFAGLRWSLAGAVGAGLAAAPYAILHYSRLESLLPHPADRALLGLGAGAFTAALAILVGVLESRARAKDRRAFEAQRRHGEEVEAKNAELARANEALAEANEALEAFTYVVSHDLKEPVRALNAFSRALEEDHGPALPQEARDLARRNVETSQRLTRLLEGLLEYSRASRLDPQDLEPVRVEEALASADATTRFEHLLAERHARLAVSPGPAVLATPGLLAQILGNLVLNALRHNPGAKPVVRITSATSRQDPRFIEVAVEDNGPGFLPAVLQRFERLRQGRPSTVRGGFGLLIAKRAVEKLGGKMWLGGSDLGGAAVRFTLPGATGPGEDPAAEEEVRVPRREPHP